MMSLRQSASAPHGGLAGWIERSGGEIVAGIRLLGRRPRGAAGLVPKRPGPVSAILGAGACVAVTVFVIIALDASTVAAARLLPVWLVQAFNDFTDYGKSGWFLWPLGVALAALALLASASQARGARLMAAMIAVRLEFLFLAIALPGLFVTIIKRVIGRARPYVGSAADPYLFDPMVWKAAYASLPSGHATTGFSVAIAFGALWPRARPLFWTYAVLVALSRVVITAHYPSDVLASAIVGIIGALLVRDAFAARRLGFAVTQDGRVRSMAGPSWRRIKGVAASLFRQ
jgi:membrane-associated phospholipid phosphatase